MNRTEQHGISFAEALRVWVRVAALSFGGPAGQIAVMHRILVDEKRWIGEARFLHALNFCMLLPGPEAQQLATYIGWLLHGTKGGLVAGTLFVLPGVIALLALSFVYVLLGHVPAIDGLFFGLKAAVLVIVIEALLRVGRRALKSRAAITIAIASFLALFLFAVPFPLVVLSAAMIGYVAARLGHADLFAAASHSTADNSYALKDALYHARPSAARALRILGIGLPLWLGPIFLFGDRGAFVEIGGFFAKMAVVTFGGAYAVLSYVAQQAVEHHGWLTPAEMLDGLGLAETTPGPLIMVVQFVGFLAAYRAPDGLPPLFAGTAGALLTSWVTFVPCFIWIFLGAPYVERLRAHRPLSAALAAITAAVVGVIANLAAWFGLHALFARLEPMRIGPFVLQLPDPASLDIATLGFVAAASLALFRFRAGIIPTLLGAAAAGAALRLVT